MGNTTSFLDGRYRRRHRRRRSRGLAASAGGAPVPDRRARRLFATARSAGMAVAIRGARYRCRGGEAGGVLGMSDLSPSSRWYGSAARALAPEAIKAGCLVIDKSSAFQARPGCSRSRRAGDQSGGARGATRASSPTRIARRRSRSWGSGSLHRRFGLRRYIAATYQSVSGAGSAAVRELEAQVLAHTRGAALKREVLPHQIAFNVFPQVDAFGPNGYTVEETKMMLESRKIMGLPLLSVSVTCVRVPVIRAAIRRRSTPNSSGQ